MVFAIAGTARKVVPIETCWTRMTTRCDLPPGCRYQHKESELSVCKHCSKNHWRGRSLFVKFVFRICYLSWFPRPEQNLGPAEIPGRAIVIAGYHRSCGIRLKCPKKSLANLWPVLRLGSVHSLQKNILDTIGTKNLSTQNAIDIWTSSYHLETSQVLTVQGHGMMLILKHVPSFTGTLAPWLDVRTCTAKSHFFGKV